MLGILIQEMGEKVNLGEEERRKRVELTLILPYAHKNLNPVLSQRYKREELGCC